MLVDRFARLFSDEYRLVIACLDEVGELGDQLMSDGFSVEFFGRNPGFDFGCARRLADFFCRERVDIVHAHQCTPFAYALAARVLGGRVAILLTEHGRFFPDSRSWKRVWFHRLMTRQCDRFVAVGESVRLALIENEGLPSERVELIYNGVRLDPSHCKVERAAVRSELGVGADEFLVIQVARLDSIKDHPTALRAVKAARETIPDIRLVVVGDGPEYAAIQSYAEELGISESVCLLGLRRDVDRLLAAADAFLLSSVSEGIPVTIIEAMGVGVPVVATSVGGVVELIDDGVTGLTAPSGDAERLAAALVKMRTTPGLAEGISIRARGRAVNQFSEQRMIERYGHVYREMVGQRCAARVSSFEPWLRRVGRRDSQWFEHD